MSSEAADELIADAKEDLYDRLGKGEQPDEICADWFGLEDDYVFDLFD